MQSSAHLHNQTFHYNDQHGPIRDSTSYQVAHTQTLLMPTRYSFCELFKSHTKVPSSGYCKSHAHLLECDNKLAHMVESIEQFHEKINRLKRIDIQDKSFLQVCQQCITNENKSRQSIGHSTEKINNFSQNNLLNSTQINKKSSKANTKENVRITISKTSNAEDLSFSKVTQDLANLLKKIQQQVQQGSEFTNMKDIAPEILEPKIKKYFSSIKSNPAAPNPTSNQSKTKDCPKIIKKASHKSIVKNLAANTSISKKHSNSSSGKFSGTSQSLSSKSSLLDKKVKCLMGIDPLKQLKAEVQKAIREHKTFTVRGCYYSVRKALLSRGWVEKFHDSYKDQLNEDLKRYQSCSIAELLPLMKREDLTTTCKNLIKSKLLKDIQVDFCWATRMDVFKELPDKVKLTLINKLKKDIFSYASKQGLCEASKYSYWYQHSNTAKFNHPRSYNLSKCSDMRDFINDFRVTAAMSLLKWIIKINITKECKLVSPTGKIPLEVFDFAVNECVKLIKKKKHEDIDKEIPEATEEEWKQFLEYFYKLIHYSNHFKNDGNETEESLVQKSNFILNNLSEFYLNVQMDGTMNIWIMKPSASSQGKGIHMCRTLQYVLKTVNQHKNIRYIIQKYIERPLLIHSTKFDIRQWFLISNCSPLTIWIYKECYLRFSSQTYNLRKLHESIHLTNNSVQCKYKKTGFDTELPSFNMWDSQQFQKYLINIGYPQAFKEIIYSGMKQCITAAVLMHQDKIVIRKKSFELYGADFILTEDFQPWLLEINSCPALHASTPVTARMCPKMLEDVIKVVIDYASNDKASTGGFELMYKENISRTNENAALEVKGLALRNSYFFDSGVQHLKQSFCVPKIDALSILTNTKQPLSEQFADDIKNTLKNLLEVIYKEKRKTKALRRG